MCFFLEVLELVLCAVFFLYFSSSGTAVFGWTIMVCLFFMVLEVLELVMCAVFFCYFSSLGTAVILIG